MMEKLSRRHFLTGLAVTGSLAQSDFGLSPQRKLERAALVSRHNPVLRKLDPLSPLSVGNGQFAFTADITGLQTFPQEYEQAMPLCTMSQWGWHTTSVRGFDRSAFRLTQFDTHGRQVGYPVSSDGQRELYNWLRENPHRLHLGQIGLRLLKQNGSEAQASDLSEIEQRLDLWSGTLTSRFKLEEKPVTVKTVVHPALALLAVMIESPLIAEGRLSVRIAFPYGSPSMQAADWKQPDKHETTLLHQGPNNVELHRRLDADAYFVSFNWGARATFVEQSAHSFVLTPARENARLEFTAVFAPHQRPHDRPFVSATFEASAQRWHRFWTTGGAVELAESRDPRAPELERRIVLSQYLTAIQCSGSLPPQETGLTVNSWYGKYHLEMHWWHAAHFALWNRLPLLAGSLGWYEHILPRAREWARSQGYTGARWPKMTAPDGRDSPSPIGPLLIWQQPHPIFYAELCYLTLRDRRTLERYRSIVFESAEFMAAFAHFDQKTQRYVLGPPLIPAQENHPPRETWNPTYELSYWLFGLKTAQRWRERLGMKREPKWDRVIEMLAPLPVRDGVYLAHENCPQTFTERNRDHPSMLGALGMLPGDDVDRETMRRTLHKVMKEWQWGETWGWDYPLTAMTAARLGETKIAIDALLMQTAKNRYLPNGHNYQRPNLPCYLPGNGGLLYAVAMMAAGWRGAPQTHAPGFPADGSWTVRWEGLNAAVLKEI
jgi:protein-glucosylgalactosylhydroxylysine glucosidase